MEKAALLLPMTLWWTCRISVTTAQGWSPACTPQNCQLPDCFCAGTDGPTSVVPLENTPQMLMLTFDDAVLKEHRKYFEKLFTKDRFNPNGCPILGTFFVCHNWTDYELVKELYHAGHEIASHTKTHRMPQSYWTYASYGDWENELEGQKDNLHQLAGIPKEHIRGARVPYLETGGDAQFQMMTDTGYLYDSSFMTGPFTQGGVWPFTLNFPPSTVYCSNNNCPKKSYPRMWEMPLNRWVGPDGRSCPMMDACDRQPKDKENTKAFLTKNFNRHYRGNRAPLGLHMHAPWFSDGGEHRLEAMGEFLDAILEEDDVYLVTMQQVLAWMVEPQSTQKAPYFEPWRTSCQLKNGKSRVDIAPLARERKLKAEIKLKKVEKSGDRSGIHRAPGKMSEHTAVPTVLPAFTQTPRTKPERSQLGNSQIRLSPKITSQGNRILDQAMKPQPRLPFYTRPKDNFTPSPFGNNLFPKSRNHKNPLVGRAYHNKKDLVNQRKDSHVVSGNLNPYSSYADEMAQHHHRHLLRPSVSHPPEIDLKINTKILDKDYIKGTEVDIESKNVNSKDTDIKVKIREANLIDKSKGGDESEKAEGIGGRLQSRKASQAAEGHTPASSEGTQLIPRSLTALVLSMAVAFSVTSW